MNNKTGITADDRIIIALDVNSFDKMKNIVDMLGDSISFTKWEWNCSTAQAVRLSPI